MRFLIKVSEYMHGSYPMDLGFNPEIDAGPLG